jgi:hypothetical protein
VSDQAWENLQYCLHDEIVRLPVVLRAAFVLCVLEGRRHEDAATELGVAVGTLSARVSRARQILLNRLTARELTMAAVALSSTAGVAAVPEPLLMIVRHSLADGFTSVSKTVVNLATAAGGSSMTMKWIASAVVAGMLATGLGGLWFANAQDKGKTPPQASPAPKATPVEAEPKLDEGPKLIAGEWSKPVTDSREYSVRGRLLLREGRQVDCARGSLRIAKRRRHETRRACALRSHRPTCPNGREIRTTPRNVKSSRNRHERPPARGWPFSVFQRVIE